jgi:UDP-glucose 4-epimerase
LRPPTSKDLPDVFVVTGASGFIGHATVAALARRGMPVLAAARQKMVMQKPIQTAQVGSYAELRPPDADSVLVHLAEPRDIGSVECGGQTFIAERRRVLADLLAKNWAHFVYVSSAAVYGDEAEASRRADDAIVLRGAYARAKVACEDEVLARGGAVARLANVYGPGMAANNVVSDILRQVPGEGVLIVQNRKPVRDYLWIDDAAEGLAALAVSGKRGIFNFGTGVGTSVEALARVALRCAGEPDRSVGVSHGAERESYLVLDISATAQELGWTPKVALAQGLKILLDAA